SPSRAFLRALPFGISCFQLSRSDFRFCHPLERAADSLFAFAFPFSAFPTLSEAFQPIESTSLTSNGESEWLITRKFNFR
ncbi:hypothetical protein, partial [Streptomyces sp. WM6378]|uniref:hypothetical protein n=1 Tax=Streptomyces sp. WM6378 TaxID=1415557 RepID=UPI001F2A3D60